MSICHICRAKAGRYGVHAACVQWREAGLSDQLIQAKSAAAITRASLETTCDTLQTLAKLLFPGFALAGGIGAAIGVGAHDVDLMIVCFVFGATAGVLAAALVYVWLKMQVLLARRISQHLG